MKRTSIVLESSASSTSAYSPGLVVELSDAKLIFLSGQTAMDANGNILSEDIEEQTRFVFENIRKLLTQAGASFDDVVKSQMFMTDIKDFSKVSPIRNEYFATSRPVNTLLEVSSLVSKGIKIEIEVIAIAPK